MLGRLKEQQLVDPAGIDPTDPGASARPGAWQTGAPLPLGSGDGPRRAQPEGAGRRPSRAVS